MSEVRSTGKKILTAIFVAIFCVSLPLAALAETLVAGGRAVGIRVSAEGVVVAGMSEVRGESPAEDAGLKEGDVIIRLGAEDIDNAEDFRDAAAKLDGGETSVTVTRAGKTRQLNITPVMDADGVWRLGLWLRDGVSGVGTLTFYDPESGVYGALGHSITDGGTSLPLGEGEIYSASISGITPGREGTPGQLEGAADPASPLGDVRINCSSGIFGQAELDGDTIETGDVCVGECEIRCTVSGDEPRSYSAEIKRVFTNDGGTGVVIHVTDPELLSVTGGIVQGMSGSPIIQNGRLVGAVTHVFVADPTSGYGISISDMLKAAKTAR